MSNNTDKIFKPRRGTKTTLSSTKANTVLDTGELFFEVPDEGQGTGRCRIKMGDGITEYSSLPYAIPFTEDEIIIHDGTDTKSISASSSIQSSAIATNLNNAKSGNSLKSILHNLREAIYKSACDISFLDNKRSYVGMIIYSTVLDTSAKVINQYGGTTWISLSGYMLRGATSSVTANNNAKDGGSDDAIVVSHTHTTPNHNHTFTGTSKNYTSGNQSANHTHSGTTGNDNNEHVHTGTTDAGGQHGHSIGVWASSGGVQFGGGLAQYPVGASSSGGVGNGVNTGALPNGNHQHTFTTGGRSAYHQHSFTTGGISANHTHTTTIKPEGTIGNASPTTNSTGSSGTNANLPNYKNVYIWERTA